MSDKSELVQKAEQVLLQMIDKAAEIGSAAVDEIPLVVQELLHWKFAESLFLFITGLIFIYVWVKISIKVWQHGCIEDEYGRKNRDRWDMIWFGYFMGTLISFLISIPWVLCNIDWLQIWIAPRVYLLEYAAHLMK